MAEEEGLLEAIAEQPGDDGQRLVYADWLEDHDQPARAEFVRLQLALARLDEDDPRRSALLTREHGLLLEHERDWTLGLRHLADGWRFRRGFVDEVTVDRPLRPEQFAELFRWRFVRRLVAGHGWRLFPGLVRCPEARTLEELRFADTELTEQQFRDLLACLHFERLTTLEASNCGLEARSIRRLAHSSLLGQLRALVLSGNQIGDHQIGDDAAAELIRSPRIGGLRLLDLTQCGLGQEAAVAIAAAPLLSGLRTLRIGHNVLGTEGAAHLLRCPHLAGLRELNFGHNLRVQSGIWDSLLHAPYPCSLRRLSIRDADILHGQLAALLTSARLGALEALDLTGGWLLENAEPGPASCQSPPQDLALLDLDLSLQSGEPEVLVDLLLNAPALGRVRRLALRNVADNADVYPALIRSPHLHQLRGLDLGRCPDLTLGTLLSSERMKRLTALDLSECRLVDDEVIDLAGHPHAAGLTWLSLRGNHISSRGAKALAASPYLGNLRHLDLSGNRIDDEGARVLAATPHLASPVVLNLADNQVGEAGMAVLFQAARQQFGRTVTIPPIDA
jgi:uncharacterized protein (TIGR02996 family)